jgi:hypothetical protein
MRGEGCGKKVEDGAARVSRGLGLQTSLKSFINRALRSRHALQKLVRLSPADTRVM